MSIGQVAEILTMFVLGATDFSVLFLVPMRTELAAALGLALLFRPPSGTQASAG